MTVREGDTWPLAHRHGLRDRDPDILHLHALGDLSDLQALFALLLTTELVNCGPDRDHDDCKEHHQNDPNLHLLKRFGLLWAFAPPRAAPALLARTPPSS
jgi:hypothetical protein